MIHNKLVIVDDELVSVGSTNFDLRSFRLNDEASLNVYDRAFSTEMRDSYERDLTRTKEYSFARWKQRPLRERIYEGFASLIESQL